MWRWSTKTENVATVGCDDLGTAPGDGSVTVGFVERLGSAERFDVVTPAEATGMNEINQSAMPAGSASAPTSSCARAWTPTGAARTAAR